jgi:hypothetical protein
MAHEFLPVSVAAPAWFVLQLGPRNDLITLIVVTHLLPDPRLSFRLLSTFFSSVHLSPTSSLCHHFGASEPFQRYHPAVESHTAAIIPSRRPVVTTIAPGGEKGKMASLSAEQHDPIGVAEAGPSNTKTGDDQTKTPKVSPFIIPNASTHRGLDCQTPMPLALCGSRHGGWLSSTPRDH